MGFATIVILEDNAGVVGDRVCVVLVKGVPRATGTRVHVRFREYAAVKLRQTVNDVDLIVIRVRKWPFRVHSGPVCPIVRIHGALLLFEADQRRRQFADGLVRFIFIRGDSRHGISGGLNVP